MTRMAKCHIGYVLNVAQKDMKKGNRVMYNVGDRVVIHDDPVYQWRTGTVKHIWDTHITVIVDGPNWRTWAGFSESQLTLLA
jgi:hypothetical protein